MLDTTSEAGARAEKRLREEAIIWLTTVRSDGQPQSVPVWFLWEGETFLVYSQPGRQKLRIGFDPNGFARSYSVALRVTPDRWQVW